MTAPLAKVQWCEYENQTLEAFVVASRLYAKFYLGTSCNPIGHYDVSNRRISV